jgi:hypothetical protein
MNDLMRRSLAAGLLSLLLVSLLLAACGGSAESESEETPATDQTEVSAPAGGAPAEVSAPAEAGEEEAEAEVEAQAESEVAQAAEEEQPAETTQPQRAPEVSASVTCEAVDLPDNGLISAPSESDWAKGSATAAITVIEYGDFQ